MVQKPKKQEALRSQVTEKSGGRSRGKSRIAAIYSELKRLYPDAHCALVFSSPCELLVATILSAQCTDVKVNQVTSKLFKEFRCPADYLEKPLEELEQLIRPTGFFRNKAKNIRAAMRSIIEDHGGEVPRTMEALAALPGVGRKTANVVLGNAFGLPGLPVDTHVTRIANRLGFTKHSDPVKIEADLTAVLPEADWCQFSHTIIFHGRQLCRARKPLCKQCPVREFCQYREETG